jgi:hypothetical protein
LFFFDSKKHESWLFSFFQSLFCLWFNFSSLLSNSYIYTLIKVFYKNYIYIWLYWEVEKESEKRNKIVRILIDYLTWLLKHVLLRRLRQKSSIIIILLVFICCHFDLQNLFSLLQSRLIPFLLRCPNTNTLSL